MYRACVRKGDEMRNARVAPMAVNATRPGLELSRLRNAVSSQTQRQSPLSATVRRNKNERKRSRGGSREGEKELGRGNGSRRGPGPFIIADAKRDVEARRVGEDTIHLPAIKPMMPRYASLSVPDHGVP